MHILYQNHKLKKQCTSQSNQKYGHECAKYLKARIGELTKAPNLEAMRSEPQAKCHELKGDKKGTLAVSLKQPFRLIFEPANDPIPRKPDGGLDWTRVTVIRILSVEDYHD